MINVMSGDHARIVANTCERCHIKMQSVAELLLLSCAARPVTVETPLENGSLNDTIGLISSTIKSLIDIVKSLISHIYNVSDEWMSVCECLQNMSIDVINLIEYCSNTAYNIAITYPDCSPAVPGVVDKYSVCYAGLEIRISCGRLKRARLEELSPSLIIDLCSNISKYISVMTDICRTAGEKVEAESTQNQFKLCVKSVTCAAGCLIASIKSFKTDPTSTHHARVLVFCEPVVASSSALVSFATETSFIGKEADLQPEAKETHKTILGACLSIVSACIQLCKTVRDLAYDIMNAEHRERTRMCTDSINRASKVLTDVLKKHSCKENEDTDLVNSLNDSPPSSASGSEKSVSTSLSSGSVSR